MYSITVIKILIDIKVHGIFSTIESSRFTSRESCSLYYAYINPLSSKIL